jgi:hypothetical protein
MLALPFSAKIVIEVYPTIGLDFGEPSRISWCPCRTCLAKERSTDATSLLTLGIMNLFTGSNYVYLKLTIARS